MPSEFSLHRLPDKNSFESVFKNGRRIVGDDFILFYLPNDLSHPRVGIVMSKRKCDLSVHRNALRRLIREYVRLNQDVLGSHDLIFLLRSTIKSVDKKHISEKLMALGNKLRRSLNPL